ncbi:MULTISPECIES: TetR family transcriptional regulator [unclassified Frankia]|uniref:TetR family transcriptional regulator n=1 Tax=unclassified Frankia TaxID=2632575 RepID=UPI0027DD8D04|nr:MULTISPECIES: TetR family transcriptional regulator [unclassified Frankia]
MRQARTDRLEAATREAETIALQLFEQRGFDVVTVEDIATAAGISARTFYRYFPAKDDVLRATVRRRAQTVAAALAARPSDEAPMHSIRRVVQDVVSAEDPTHLARWNRVVEASPHATRTVLGANILEFNAVLAEFLSSRAGQTPDDLAPAMLATAAGAIIQAAQTRWHLLGGDLATTIGDALAVLDTVVLDQSSTATSQRDHPAT